MRSITTSPPFSDDTTQCGATECWMEVYSDAMQIFIDIFVHCSTFPFFKVNNTNIGAGWQNVAAFLYSIRSQITVFTANTGYSMKSSDD